MNHLPFTLTAYFLASTTILMDKFLLTKSIKSPLIYIFYFSLFSLLAILALPFTHIPTYDVFMLGSLSSLCWIGGSYCILRALRDGSVSRVIPLTGTLISLFLLTFSAMVGTLGPYDIQAVIFFIFGLVFLTLPDWHGEITTKEIMLEVVGACLFATSWILLREGYVRDDFLTVFTWSRLIFIPVGLALVLIPRSREIILSKQKDSFHLKSQKGVLFIVDQVVGGIANVLINFSVTLATPALVQSMQGVQYIFVFLLGLVFTKRFPKIFKEDLTLYHLTTKAIGIVCITYGIYLLAMFTV